MEVIWNNGFLFLLSEEPKATVACEEATKA